MRDPEEPEKEPSAHSGVESAWTDTEQEDLDGEGTKKTASPDRNGFLARLTTRGTKGSGGSSPWRGASTRFEPGPLGLLGMMLAAMSVTLLLLQGGTGGFGGDGEEAEETPDTIPGPPGEELRIMPVGGSLTQGSSGDHTWRYHLWSHLDALDVEFDFVGPHDDVYSLEDEDFGDHSYADPDFDPEHAARWGRSAQELAGETAEVAAEYAPHYLLLLAGTEDILSGDGAEHALESIGETVSTVRVALDEARFVIGELPPVEGTGDDERFNSEIEHFNMGLVDLAEQLTSGDSPVVIARVAEDYAPAHDHWDDRHPNTRGEIKIAAAFADALADPLGVGDTYPRPFPELSVGPRTAPEPRAEEGTDGLLLSWENVPGATDYRVVQRRMEPDPDEATVLPAEVESDGRERFLLVEALLSGAEYEFVVHPYKGRDKGKASAPIELVYDDQPPSGPEGIRVRTDGTVTWKRVGDASHYEVWARVLDCAVGDDSRSPVEESDLEAMDNTDDNDAEDEPADPEPRPSDPSRPDPPPAEPSDPPVSPPSSGSCDPRDDKGPGSGDGWQTLGSVEEGPEWEPTISGPYEIVIRSYRDYVPGGYSDSVLLEG